MAEIKHWLTDREYMDAARFTVRYKDYFNLKNFRYISKNITISANDGNPINIFAICTCKKNNSNDLIDTCIK